MVHNDVQIEKMRYAKIIFRTIQASGLYIFDLEPYSNYYLLLCKQCGLLRKTEKNEIHEDGTFELSWQMDLEEETFEMIQVRTMIWIFFMFLLSSENLL